MLSLRSRFLLVGAVLGIGLAAAVAGDPLQGRAQPPSVLPIATVPASTATPLATVSQTSAPLSIATAPDGAALPILPHYVEKPQPHFLCFARDFEAAPDASAEAQTLAQFTSTFVPTEGKHMAVFVHPLTKQPVRVWFWLAHGTWQASATSHVVVFMSSQNSRVQIVFQPFGKVSVVTTAGVTFAGGGSFDPIR
jgi:hypothetical protein